MASLNIRKGDYVQVISGEEKGKSGAVLSTDPVKRTVTIDGINIVKKHKKARSAQEQSAIINKAAAMDASNVMIVCPECGKTTRVAHKFEDKDGKQIKIRVCKKCGASLEVKKAVSKAKSAAKKATKASSSTKEASATTAKKTTRASSSTKTSTTTKTAVRKKSVAKEPAKEEA